MADVEQLKNKQRQYVYAYNRICGICRSLLSEVKILDEIIELTPECYYVNDTNVCGKYVQEVRNRLVSDYNNMVERILPQTLNVIDRLTQEIDSAMQG